MSFTQPGSPQAGYTLPVFACAAAVAALRHLQNRSDKPRSVTLDLLNPPRTAEIDIAQIAALPDGSVLAITYSDPGDNLDLTRHTPLWAVVSWGNSQQPDPIRLKAGEGVGTLPGQGGKAAIYRYAHQLIDHNLACRLSEHQRIQVTIILPEGRSLAERTSNSAFGVVEGLSLLGTSGISEPLSAPGQLELARQTLRQKAALYPYLVFCLGENGLDLALKLGIKPQYRLKTANWLGPLLVEAGQLGVRGVLLLGYHGKLIKLAGGIFHTHHHVADGRQEILAAYCITQDVPNQVMRAVLEAQTVEAGLQILRAHDGECTLAIYRDIAIRIDERASAYVKSHTGQALLVGSILFDRRRQIVATSSLGRHLFEQVLVD